MSSTIFPTPYAAILSAIWGIMKIAQAGTNNLGNVDFKHNYEYYITQDGSTNPLDWLHPECRDGGVA